MPQLMFPQALFRAFEDDFMLNNQLMEHHFTQEYNPKSSLWGGETVCGEGSVLDKNLSFIEWLGRKTQELGIESIIDVGCGDMNYMKHFLNRFEGLRYCGVDISKPLIESNSETYSLLDFQHLNICDSTPVGHHQLCIVKEVFIHISKEQVLNAISNIRKIDGLEYLLVSGHIEGFSIIESGDEYGHFAYHFQGLENYELVDSFVDNEVRMFRLYSLRPNA